MHITIAHFITWVVAVAVTWLSAIAVLTVLGSNRSDAMKALWIAIIVCTPIVGPLSFWMLGQSATDDKDLAQREAAIKSRCNEARAER